MQNEENKIQTDNSEQSNETDSRGWITYQFTLHNFNFPWYSMKNDSDGTYEILDSREKAVARNVPPEFLGIIMHTQRASYDLIQKLWDEKFNWLRLCPGDNFVMIRADLFNFRLPDEWNGWEANFMRLIRYLEELKLIKRIEIKTEKQNA